jgi:hypothetical protein
MIRDGAAKAAAEKGISPSPSIEPQPPYEPLPSWFTVSLAALTTPQQRPGFSLFLGRRLAIIDLTTGNVDRQLGKLSWIARTFSSGLRLALIKVAHYPISSLIAVARII